MDREEADLIVLVCEDDITDEEFMNNGYLIEDLYFAIQQIPEALKYELIKSN